MHSTLTLTFTRQQYSRRRHEREHDLHPFPATVTQSQVVSVLEWRHARGVRTLHQVRIRQRLKERGSALHLKLKNFKNEIHQSHRYSEATQQVKNK